VSGTFLTTRWSVVASAGRTAGTPRTGADAHDALAELCAAYWPPLYAFARRSGASPHDAADLVQGFFARLLEKGDLADISPARGRFRAWLVTAFRNFQANARDRERAQKRGGGRAPLPISADAAETLYAPEPADPRTPEREFERRWALTLLDRVLQRLGAEQARAGKQAEFTALRPWLTAGGGEGGYAALADQLGRSEGALKVAVHRLRRRYGELLREEVAGTLDDPAEVEAELAALLEALAS